MGVLPTEAYSPFGITLKNSAANDNQAGFTGHIKDKATGLNYMQARYYDPVIGRFLSVDPVGFMDTGHPGYFNRYSYVQNDPINMIDPLGLCSTSADGGLTDCPPVQEIEGGVVMQGAEFNGLQTNYVSADNMETLTEVVGAVDSATQTDAGQGVLVGGQEAGGMDVNLIVNSGQTNENGQGTYTSAGQVIGTSYVDTAETLDVGVLGGRTSTGHGFVTGSGVASVAERVIHELGHATNPNQGEEAIQGLSNTIFREMGNRQIIHGR